MGCRIIPGVGIACSRGTMGGKPVCCMPGCSRAAAHLCDWKLKGRKAGETCSAPICASHALEVGPEKHLCPAHAAAWANHPSNPKNQTNPETKT